MDNKGVKVWPTIPSSFGKDLGVTDAGHNIIILFYHNAAVSEQNYQEKADAACVTDFPDCVESPGCILGDAFCVI